MEALLLLQTWYKKQCNGVWEHSYGVSIETLDNPGWKVHIDLKEEIYRGEDWPEIRVDNGEDDWLICGFKKGCFEGVGDPLKLEKIVSFFLDAVAKASKQEDISSLKKPQADYDSGD